MSKFLTCPASVLSDWEADDYMLSQTFVGVALFEVAAVAAMSRKRKRAKVHGGSKPGKRPNRNIGRQAGARRIDRDYLCRRNEHAVLSACFTDADVERRYRVPRDVYERIRDKLFLWDDKYFVERVDCCGVRGASTDQKLWAAMRQLSYGVPADAVTEYDRLAESTNA
jgi:hypothetical protein